MKIKLRPGKLDLEFLGKLLARYTLTDERVVLGPAIGEDAAVLNPGGDSGTYLVVTSDPITFATDQIGYYAVTVNANDIATRGATPRWFLATLLFPENSTKDLAEEIFSQIRDACSRLGISIIGGHTEVTPGIDRVIVSGHMIGEVPRDKLVSTGGAKSGDLLLLAKGICIEGTSIIAREKEKDLRDRGIPLSTIQRAKAFIFDPGIDVVGPARIACGTARINSMHDPTEGGIVNGIVEMAIASGKSIYIDVEKIPIYPESRLLCEAFDLNPLGVIASGALLLTVPPEEYPSIKKAFGAASVPIETIGEVREGPAGLFFRTQGEVRQVNPFPCDEILKIF